MYMDPTVLAELPPEILALLAAENGGNIPGYGQNSMSMSGGFGRTDTAGLQQHYQDDINEAIIQSLFEQEQNAEEEQILREVMKISALEHQKQIGALNLDHLKRKAKQQSPENRKNGGGEDKLNTSYKNLELPPVVVSKINPNNQVVLPPPRVVKKNLQQNSRNNEHDNAEEKKFMEILNQTANQAQNVVRDTT